MLITSSWSFDLLLVFATTVFLFYKYITRNFDYWKKRGVFYIKPTPFFGNFYDTVMLRKNIAQGLKDLYDKTNLPYFGMFVVDTPVLVLKSPKLIEHVMIKDFSYFSDRSMAAPKHNPIVSNFLLFQTYNDWKKTRPKISPLFSNSKLKGMFYVAEDIVKELNEFIKNNIGIIEAKGLATRFSAEVVTRCYFGIKGFCFKNGTSKILEITQRSINFSLRNAIVHGLYLLKPAWVDLFSLNFMKISDQNYLIDAFLEVVKARKASKTTNEKAVDYIDIILKAKETGDLDTSKAGFVEVISNTLQFFLAGTETMSGVQSFTSYELAINPKAQNKLRKEILEVIEKYGGLTFESLNEMKYLDCCILESMRKYISLQILDRKAVQDYTIPGTDFVIEKGTVIYIPYHAIHNDEKWFPNPDKYIPERFQELKVNEDGLTYMPFGAGPRACTGERFGLLMTKYLLATTISSFELEACEATPIPVKFTAKAFTVQSEHGLPIRYKPYNRI